MEQKKRNSGSLFRTAIHFMPGTILTQGTSQNWVSLVAQRVKNLPVMQETQVQSLGQEDPWRREWLLRTKGKGDLTGAVIMSGEERCDIIYIYIYSIDIYMKLLQRTLSKGVVSHIQVVRHHWMQLKNRKTREEAEKSVWRIRQSFRKNDIVAFS